MLTCKHANSSPSIFPKSKNCKKSELQSHGLAFLHKSLQKKFVCDGNTIAIMLTCKHANSSPSIFPKSKNCKKSELQSHGMAFLHKSLPKKFVLPWEHNCYHASMQECKLLTLNLSEIKELQK